MSGAPPVSDAELHAFVDGALAAADRARVEAWLHEHAEEAARVRAWRDDVQLLREAYADVAVPGAPSHRLLSPRRFAFARAAAIAVVAFGLGVGLGATGSGRLEPEAVPPLWAEAGVSAHKVFVSEVRHPVEVAAADREHLVGWLSKRIGAPLEPPDLSGEGLTLLGGRLVADDGAPSAMLMYEDASGNRLSLLVAHRQGFSETAFRVWEESGVSAVYWIDGPLGYILVGEVDRARLIQIAHKVHAAFT